jgi:23S rRNA (uracil1939-C5)-methyltransferase
LGCEQVQLPRHPEEARKIARKKMDITPESRPLQVGAEYEGEIEKLVYGGEGLLRVGSWTVLVPLTAAGDRVRVRILSIDRRLARATLVTVLDPSPTRRTPPCRYFGRCGGCQLQHLTDEAQREAKVGFIRESLRRLGGIDWSGPLPILFGDPWGYRSRAELRIVRTAGGEPRIGFLEAASDRLCEVEEDCPVLPREANRTLQEWRNAPSRLPSEATRLYVVTGEGPNGPEAQVVPATGEGARAAEVDARGTVEQTVGAYRYRYGIRSFFQGNRFLVEPLVETALGDVRGETAIDLYAGVGLFTLPLASRFRRVCAVEGSRLSVAHGEANVRRHGLQNVTYHPLSVEHWLGQRSRGWERPDLLLLDPPRAGAGRVVIERIVALAPAQIAYVSCDPATLARDLKQLAATGYHPTAVTAVDLFPQTYHVETVVQLRRSF